MCQVLGSSPSLDQASQLVGVFPFGLSFAVKYPLVIRDPNAERSTGYTKEMGTAKVIYRGLFFFCGLLACFGVRRSIGWNPPVGCSVCDMMDGTCGGVRVDKSHPALMEPVL